MNEKIELFWNDFFSKLESEKIDLSDAKVANKLDEYLKILGDNCEKVLEIGSGSGYGLLTSLILGDKTNYCLGIDPSENAVSFVNETVKKSGIEGIECLVANHKFLKELPDKSFDGIISLNVLDVLPKDIAAVIIDEINRIIADDGFLVLKFNFYLTDELIEKINMEAIDENSYMINGVLRAVNRTLDEWVEMFSEFELVEKSTYERVPNGPLDRVLLMKKK